MVKREDLEEIKRLAAALKEAGINVKALYLYGSRVKGEAGRDSDIDVAIISEDFSGNLSADLKSVLPALKKSNVAIEPVFYRPEDFREEDPLVWEIQHSGVKVVV